MSFIKSHKKWSGLVALLLVGGVALAAWLVTASGPGAGKIGSLVAPTVQVGTVAGSACYPGHTCSGYFTITNPNDAPLTVSSVEDAGGGSTENNSVCPVGSITVPNQGGLNVVVAPGTSSVVIPNLFALDANAPNGCQGLSFTRNVTLNFST